MIKGTKKSMSLYLKICIYLNTKLSCRTTKYKLSIVSFLFDIFLVNFQIQSDMIRRKRCIYMKDRTEFLTIKLSKEEKEYVLQFAEKTCLSESDLILLAILSLGEPTKMKWQKYQIRKNQKLFLKTKTN